MTTSPLSELVTRHKALAHPVRLRVLAMLRSGELCACQIAAVLELAPRPSPRIWRSCDGLD